jgi:hypothetical protein
MDADDNFYKYWRTLAKYCNISNKKCLVSIQYGMLIRPNETNLMKSKFDPVPFFRNEKVLNINNKTKIKNVRW